ncbi:L/D-transpeptidase catalytic domain protein [Synechococcus sp. Minos11]|nr:L/D-transpeptidase catalytic domain protein [Synechococcus sp. Minos11]
MEGVVLAVLTSLLAAALPWQPTELVLERSKRQLRVIQNGRQIASYPVAVGRATNPTPLGTHRVHRLEKDPIWSSPWRKRQVTASATGPLGTRWIGFWYRCGKRSSTDRRPPRFEADNCREIGFHGTGKLSSIGQAATFGCVRLRNQDAISLFDLVKEGDIVRVVP